MNTLWPKLTNLWCKAMHPAPMWPINGHYVCPRCLRSYPVPWEQPLPVSPAPEERTETIARSTAPAAAVSR